MKGLDVTRPIVFTTDLEHLGKNNASLLAERTCNNANMNQLKHYAWFVCWEVWASGSRVCFGFSVSEM